jgi:3-dehydroquinate dehydratase type I
MKLIVTISEETPELALAAISALEQRHDAVEVRFDAFGQHAYDFAAFRAATSKPLLATNRGHGHVDVDAAIAAGIDLVDVEWQPGLTIDRHRERIVVSHHDWDGVPELEPLIDAMRALGCAETKIAVTPQTLHENERLLDAVRRYEGLTIFGMGERGLYSRILAPFFGSRLAFVAPDAEHAAAPGQLALERALAIYGDGDLPRNPRVFAIAGDPAGHSLSPSIHNPLFREHGVAAAYTIASFATFDEIAEAFVARRITGLSVTAPFKENAFAFAQREGADLRENAVATGAVNTLVHIGGRIVADNTDVDGFLALLAGVDARTAAIVGAGGTARAARVALEKRNILVTIYNRTRGKLGAQPLEELVHFRGDLIVNTLTSGVAVALPSAIAVIDASYTRNPATGLQLLRAQAFRQNECFLEAMR